MEGNGTMSNQHYTAAAWLCFANALITLPHLALAVLRDIGVIPDLAAIPVLVALNLVNLSISIYTWIVFLELMKDRYGDARGMVPFVYAHLLLLCLLGGLAIFARTVGVPKGWALVLLMMLLIPTGACAIVIGVKTLHLPDDLIGLGRPFGLLLIVGWALPMTWILIPVGMFVAAAATVVMGIVFLRTARGAAPEFV